MNMRAIALLTCFTAVISGPVNAGPLDDDLALFLEWFPGEYDNNEQHWQDTIDRVPQVHEHIHHIFYPVEANAIGEHVFYVQQYMDGDPANIYRQRLYSFSLDEAEGAIRLDIYSYNDEARYRDAHLNPVILSAITMDELQARPGCEVYWQLQNDAAGDYFHGYMKEKACRVVSRRSGKPIYITDDLRLTADEIWIRDEAFFEDGSRVFGNAAGIHHKNRKVHYYSGWAGFSSQGPAIVIDDGNWQGTESGGWSFNGELDVFGRFVIHNEGQIVPVVSEDGTPSGYSVQLAKLTYQNTTTPILTLKLFEDATGKNIAYAWGDTEAGRIGINTRWAQSGLTRNEGLPSWGFTEAAQVAE